jgi:hypothetical protein
MPTPQLSHDADGADSWGRLQDRHDIDIPDRSQRVWSPPPAGLLLL